MSKPCKHATSGCDYPASECAGHCASKQPEALRLAELIENPGAPLDIEERCAAELRRLHELNQELMRAYRKMYNAAAGYSNYCDDSANVSRCERDFEEADAMFRAVIAKTTGAAHD